MNNSLIETYTAAVLEFGFREDSPASPSATADPADVAAFAERVREESAAARKLYQG